MTSARRSSATTVGLPGDDRLGPRVNLGLQARQRGRSVGIDASTLMRPLALPVTPCATTSQHPIELNINEVGKGPGRPAEVGAKEAEPVVRPSVRCTVTAGGWDIVVQMPSFMKYCFPSQCTSWLHVPVVGGMNQVSPEPTAMSWPIAASAAGAATGWIVSSHGSGLAGAGPVATQAETASAATKRKAKTSATLVMETDQLRAVAAESSRPTRTRVLGRGRGARIALTMEKYPHRPKMDRVVTQPAAQ